MVTAGELGEIIGTILTKIGLFALGYWLGHRALTRYLEKRKEDKENK